MSATRRTRRASAAEAAAPEHVTVERADGSRTWARVVERFARTAVLAVVGVELLFSRRGGGYVAGYRLSAAAREALWSKPEGER